ncbi:phosphonate transport system substrate-binding protein [Halospina denitrificans]|uniref:Phosphonate transport system substrate-binding protein n=1 Tax=Halospina denitrificans TaxID=332522 RepID=A0A4R7K128_9GAMM|nr:putative selenate ABC transporter substrate-binding protein [Halospina denitrificans]TDT44511.1 phosphonate transport system substrate-binding protein [Halospina denitrificans]
MRWILITLLATLTAFTQANAETLYFTAIPDEDETRLEERFSKVADYLADELDVDVRFVPVKSYAASVTAFRNNQVQLAWFGGLSGVRARDRVDGAEAIAQGVEDQEFRSYFIANTGTGIEKADELPGTVQGKTLAFGSRGSTSGRLMPEYYIRQRFGQPPEDVFSRVGFSGNHTRTVALVESGAYQVGALNYTVWDKLVEEGDVDTDKVRVIWKSPTYPDYQWTIRGDVNERFGDGFKERVKEALLSMEDPELLESFPRSGFIPASNDDYSTIREVGQETGLLD